MICMMMGVFLYCDGNAVAMFPQARTREPVPIQRGYTGGTLDPSKHETMCELRQYQRDIGINMPELPSCKGITNGSQTERRR